MKSKVSVIIPTRNRAELLTRALNSALRQTYPYFEIIIIDDASEDNTAAIVQNFKDERLRYILLKKNMGAAAARNTGIEQAGGEYVAFLDSDDQWHPEKLAHQVGAMESLSSRVGIVYCVTERI
jgi:glycosyltransferase involved in cell wall biosynthesis